jgi:hypothetical protein
LRWSGLARNYFDLLSIHYTAGEPIEMLGDLFQKVVECLEQSVIAKGVFYGDDEQNKQWVLGGSEGSYVNGLQHISLCYLLHRRDLLPRIHTLVYGTGKNKRKYADGVYNQMLGFYTGWEEPNNTWNTDYVDFSNTFYEENTKEEALADLTSYLKEWYAPLHEDEDWYNGHLSLDKYYFYKGYWSFEAAAVVYLLDLDDTSLHHFLYYPKDLVAYARSKPADSSPPPAPPPEIKPPPSRYTGYAVEVGQVCQETGSYECPRMEGRIVVLMQGQTVLGDKYNQMGAIIWYKLTIEAEREHLKKARFARSRG